MYKAGGRKIKIQLVVWRERGDVRVVRVNLGFPRKDYFAPDSVVRFDSFPFSLEEATAWHVRSSGFPFTK